MCDEFGFYVYNECNIESQGMGFQMSKTLSQNRPVNYECVHFLSNNTDMNVLMMKHIDVRWLAVLDASKKGLLISCDTKFEFNALKNPVEDFDDEDQKDPKYQLYNFGWSQNGKNELKRQHHIDKVIPHDYGEVNLDLKQEGVAGFNCWGDKPLPKFSIKNDKNYFYKLTIIPISNEDEIAKKLTHYYE